jgi:phosphoenolpyruvate carboxykinase (ATP)
MDQWKPGFRQSSFYLSKRIPLKFTRAIIDAIHNGELDKAEYEETEIFKLQIPKNITGVPSEILNPQNSWKDKNEFKQNLRKLAEEFVLNFDKFTNEKSTRFISGGPQLK